MEENLGRVLGWAGWTAQHTFEADGAGRLVMKLADYIGGEGDKPTANVGKYLKADGTYVTNKADAANFKGLQGFAGWAPILAIESHGTGKVSKVVDWVGGEGDKPTLTGYIGATGIVADIADAVVYGQKGDTGSPGISTPNMATNRMLGRTSSGTGTPEELELIGGFLEAGKAIVGYSGSGGSSQNLHRRINNPLGGALKTSSSGNTGAIQIKVPAAASTLICYIKGQITRYSSALTGSSTIDFLISFVPTNTFDGSMAVLTSDLNLNLAVRWTHDGTNKYIYIGELSGIFNNTNIVIDTFVVSGTPTTTAYANSPFEISIQPTAFIGTINKTQTECRPQFNPNQVMSDFVTGTNTPFLNTDTLNQMLGKAQAQINARLTQPQGDARYNGKSIYNAQNGVLMVTDIADNSDVMFNLELKVNGYASEIPAYALFQGYLYLSGGSTTLINCKGITVGGAGSLGNQPLYIFKYNGYLCFWLDLQSVGTFKSLSAYCYTTRNTDSTKAGADTGNRITSISNVIKPTTGVTGEVSVTPYRALMNYGLSTNLVLGDGTYQALATLPAFTATKFATPRTINGVNFDGTANITIADNTKIPTSEKGANNGVATLDASGKLTSSQVPAIAITDTFVVNNQSAMLALTAQVGDVAVRSDLSKSFILKTEPATTLANWQELLTPTGGVSTVNGRSGAITLTPADIPQDSSNRFVTDTEKAIWNGKASVLSNTTTISSTDATVVLYKDVTVTGATVGMCAFTSDPLLYNSSLGKYYRLYPRVISANTVRVYIQSFYFVAGTSDAEFYDTTFATDLQDLQSGDKTITIKVI